MLAFFRIIRFARLFAFHDFCIAYLWAQRALQGRRWNFCYEFVNLWICSVSSAQKTRIAIKKWRHTIEKFSPKRKVIKILKCNKTENKKKHTPTIATTAAANMRLFFANIYSKLYMNKCIIMHNERQLGANGQKPTYSVCAKKRASTSLLQQIDEGSNVVKFGLLLLLCMRNGTPMCPGLYWCSPKLS